MIAPAFHPIVTELTWTVRNRMRAQFARPLESVFLVLVWSVALLILAFGWSRLPGEQLAAVIEAATNSPWSSTITLAVLSLFALRAPLRALRRHLAHSWWAALPIAPARTQRSVAALGVLMIGAFALAADGLLLAAAALVQHPERWLAAARTIASAGIVIGGGAGLASALRRDADLEHATRRSSHGLPLFRLGALERVELPTILRWQRTETLRRFRAGGRWWQWVLLGLAVPAGITLRSLTGLVLTGVLLIWFGIAMTAARETIANSARLTLATPLAFAPFARASARYPLLVAALASGWGLLALWMQDAPRWFMVGWPVLLFAWTVLELALAWHLRRQSRRVGLRLAVDVAVIVAAAQLFAPLAALAWALVVGMHLRAAGNIR